MKKINNIIAAAFTATVLLSSCTKSSILDINTNPNSATNSTPQLTMPAALDLVARNNLQDYTDIAMWMGYTAYSGSYAKPALTYSYQITSAFSNAVNAWADIDQSLTNLNYVVTQAQAQSLPLYEAIGKIMMAYQFANKVDLFNNVPYSDALRKTGSVTPKYDNGSDVYDSAVALLNSAIALLNNDGTKNTIVKSIDNERVIVYKGSLPDLTQWIRLANTFKLKLLINESNVSSKSSYVATEMATIDPTELLQIGDDAEVDAGYLNSTGKLSPFYGNYYSAPGTASDNYKVYQANTYAISFYENNNDPRIGSFYDPTSGTTYVGNQFGISGGVQASSIGSYLLNPTAPALLFSAAEGLFLQAEAVQRGLLQGDAEQLYKNAITASFEYLGLTAAQAVTYYSQSNSNVNWESASNKLQLIITQKWAALNNLNILSVYTDYRRTGYPSLPISVYPGHLANIPVRMPYPQREYNVNGTNVNAQGTINTQTDKIFWNQ